MSVSTMTDKSQRYRIKKTSLHERKHSWQPHEESTLNEILEQERQAWLANSPKEVSSHDYSESDGEMPEDEDDASRTVRGRGPHKATRQKTQSSVPPSLATRKSFFQEGSMTQGSRAVASTWEQQDSSCPQTRSTTSSIVSFDESDATTARPSLSSRPSFSSSIDINEFKPLPATPSTFKTTIKRFGQKLKPFEPPASYDTGTVKARDQLKLPRKGLRRSMSTWKIFPGSISDADGESDTALKQETKRNVKTKSTSRTLRFKNRGKQEAKIDERQKSVLDERKRKAEIAYAEQFGTFQERHGQTKPLQSHQPMPHFNDDYATVRRTGPAPVLQKHAIAVCAAQGQNGPEQSLQPDMPADPGVAALEYIVANSLRQAPHHRSGSQDSNATTSSDQKRRRRTSRSELEKENQQLRSMLKEKQHREHLQQSAVRNNWSLSCGRALENRPTTSNQDSAPNWQVHEDNAENEDMPPMPALPLAIPGRAPMMSFNARPSQVSIPVTIKRRELEFNLGRSIVLPRPLSMVLEGAEEETNDSRVKMSTSEDCEGSPRKKAHLSCDGATDEDTKPQSTNEMSGVIVADGKWDWPEDVF